MLIAGALLGSVPGVRCTNHATVTSAPTIAVSATTLPAPIAAAFGATDAARGVVVATVAPAPTASATFARTRAATSADGSKPRRAAATRLRDVGPRPVIAG